jgi:hypothetical protein
VPPNKRVPIRLQFDHWLEYFRRDGALGFGISASPSPRAARDSCCHHYSRRQVYVNGASASLQDLRQVRTYQIAPFVQAVCIAPWAIAVKLFLPFHHVCLAAVFLDEFADTITTFAGALGAFDAEHVELMGEIDLARAGRRPRLSPPDG